VIAAKVLKKGCLKGAKDGQGIGRRYFFPHPTGDPRAS